MKTVAITLAGLVAALTTWTTQARNGETRPHAEADAFPVEQVATESAEHLFPLLQAHGGVPKLGALWPEQGGIYAGLVRGHDGHGDYHLIVAPREVQDTLEDLEFGPYGAEVAGANSQWDGRANTMALIDAGEGYQAAKACADLEHAGHHDWYLAAADEARVAKANAGEQFNPDDYAWTSTQYSSYYAWAQDFAHGLSLILNKLNEFRAVAVRRLVI